MYAFECTTNILFQWTGIIFSSFILPLSISIYQSIYLSTFSFSLAPKLNLFFVLVFVSFLNISNCNACKFWIPTTLMFKSLFPNLFQSSKTHNLHWIRAPLSTIYVPRRIYCWWKMRTNASVCISKVAWMVNVAIHSIRLTKVCSCRKLIQAVQHDVMDG